MGENILGRAAYEWLLWQRAKEEAAQEGQEGVQENEEGKGARPAGCNRRRTRDDSSFAQTRARFVLCAQEKKIKKEKKRRKDKKDKKRH